MRKAKTENTMRLQRNGVDRKNDFFERHSDVDVDVEVDVDVVDDANDAS